MVTYKQFQEFASAVIRQLPSNMSHQQMQAYIEDQGRLAADLRNGLMPPADSSAEYMLVYTPTIVTELGDDGKYTRYHNPNINDDNYPSNGEDGVVRYNFIPGEELKRSNGWVYRSDVETYFSERGMRSPNAAEALLPPAKDKQLGRGAHPLVAFIGGSRAAFIVHEDSLERSLNHYKGFDPWYTSYEFLAVCE